MGLPGFTDAIGAMLPGGFDRTADEDEGVIEAIAPTALVSTVVAVSAFGTGSPPQANAAVAGSAAPTLAGAVSPNPVAAGGSTLVEASASVGGSDQPAAADSDEGDATEPSAVR